MKTEFLIKFSRISSTDEDQLILEESENQSAKRCFAPIAVGIICDLGHRVHRIAPIEKIFTTF